MEVGKGYKNTEIGIYPQDWNISTLAAISVIERGKFTARPRNDPKYYGGNIPFIQTGDVTNSNGIIDSFSQTLNENGLKVSKLFPKGTLFFTIAANIGDVGFCNFDTACPDSLVAISVSEQIDKQWLYYELQKRKKSFENIATHNAQLNLSLEKLRPYLIPVPPLAEQHAIATALSDMDSLLIALDALIAKKHLIKQGTMQELLTGKKRLPGFRGKGYKRTDFGNIPDDWEMKRIGDLFEITSSKRVFQSEWRTSGVPFYRARELAVLGEQGYVNNELFITKEMYASYKNIYGVPQKGDMLVTGVGTLGKVYVVSDDREFYFKDGNIIWFKASGTVIPEFLKQLYLTKLIMKQIEDGSAGTTVGTYTISGAKKTVIPYPSLPEQTTIAEILSDMDAEIATLEARREKTSLLKHGMMQELLTGKIRLV